MGVQPYTKVETLWAGYPAILYRWTLTNTDTGAPARIPAHADITCQVTGVIATGAGTIAFEGTLDSSLIPASSAYGALHQPDMTAASATVTGTLLQILEHPLQIRPHCTSGDGGTAAVCDVLVVKQWKE